MDFQPVFVLGRFIDLAGVDGEGGAQAMPVVAGADDDFQIEGHGHVLQPDFCGAFFHARAADAKSGMTADRADVTDGFDLGGWGRFGEGCSGRRGRSYHQPLKRGLWAAVAKWPDIDRPRARLSTLQGRRTF